MKSKVLSIFLVVVSCFGFIALVNAQGLAYIGQTLEYNDSLSGTASFGIDFYTKTYATNLSVNKPVINTKTKVKKLLIWSTIAESEETIKQTKKVYANYWTYDTALKHQVTWKNMTKESSITGNFESYNG